MKKNNTTFYMIGENIRALRKLRNLTQENLAKELEVSNKTISKWELGDCVPEADAMSKICDFFNVNYFMLEQYDFTALSQILNKKISIKNLPLENEIEKVNNNPRALENKNYKRANEIMEETSDFDIYSLKNIIYFYRKAYKELSPEAAINMINLYLSIIVLKNIPENEAEKLTTLISENSAEINASIFFELFFSKPKTQISSDEKELEDILKEAKTDIWSCIYILKKTDEYKELAEYYIAMSYMFGIAPNDYDRKTNLMFGLELINTFKTLGNKYFN